MTTLSSINWLSVGDAINSGRVAIACSPGLKDSPEFVAHSMLASSRSSANDTPFEVPVKRADLAAFVDGDARNYIGYGLVGIGLTTQAHRHFDPSSVSLASKYTRMIDTVIVNRGKRIATNAMIGAIMEAVNRRKIDSDTRALIIGTSPIATSAVLAMKALGLDVTVTDKVSSKVVSFTRRLDGIQSATWEHRHSVRCDIIINTRSEGSGTGNDRHGSVWSEPFEIGTNKLVVDCAHNKEHTKLCVDALAGQCRVATGADIVVEKCIERRRMWGLRAPSALQIGSATRYIESRSLEDALTDRTINYPRSDRRDISLTMYDIEARATDRYDIRRERERALDALLEFPTTW